jgi:hypothetical protein
VRSWSSRPLHLTDEQLGLGTLRGGMVAAAGAPEVLRLIAHKVADVGPVDDDAVRLVLDAASVQMK